jgi:starvation-inducible DNA-binding protein
MDELVSQMKKLQANVFALYLKAHYFHWNVEGPHFAAMHKFFGDLYEEIFDSIDLIAEQIRVLKAYAPGSLTRYLELSDIEEIDTIPNMIDMVSGLIKDNQIVINHLSKAYTLAETNQQLGLANFLQDRIDIHQKHQWMLISINTN